MDNHIKRSKIEEFMEKQSLSVKSTDGSVQIKCKLKYTANGPDGPHWTSKIASILVNNKEVGYIDYHGEPTEPEVKKIELILNEHLNNGFNTIELHIVVDDGIMGNPTSSKAHFRMYSNKKKFVDVRYDTKTPSRISNDLWIIYFKSHGYKRSE